LEVPGQNKQTQTQGGKMISITNKLVSIGTAIALLSMSTGLPQAVSAPKPTNINIVPTITSVALVNGQLVATGTATAVIHGQTTTVPFSAPLDITAIPQPGVCPVLDLRLGPINLNLLGLVVQTSPICLTITAFENGGLLGQLLCSLANLLNQGLTLPQALATFTPDQLNTLLSGITDLLNQSLANLYQVVLTSVTRPGTHHTCAILHLELGPLDLTLLGLEVVLDNCANGAITVDITAVTGRGNLLGNLLCELLGGGLINLGATLQDILNQIIGLLTQ
jgi:hypothetical protein